MIVKTNGILDGAARVQGTRAAVWLLEHFRRMGVGDNRLLLQYPGVTQSDLLDVWEYVDSHKEEIDIEIQLNCHE